MKLIISILLIALLAFTAGLYLDWWSIAPAAFIVSLCIRQSPGRSFLAGFIALFLLWGGLALAIDNSNDHLLSHRIAQLLRLGSSSFLLVLVTALVGAIVAGLASLAAGYATTRKR
ncbi:MAG: hypothetical protein JST39_08105 [Bacteroidetes bacterium]|nr:hypothetical protein [Bacteroidota bacterium]